MSRIPRRHAAHRVPCSTIRPQHDIIGTQASHYRLDRRLGAGTYGEVYEGVHVHDEELRVAVKIVAPALARDPQFVDALKRECRQLDRMAHANVVRFRELVVTHDAPEDSSVALPFAARMRDGT